MKHLAGITTLVAAAFVLRFAPLPGATFDMSVHDRYFAIPVGVIGFWLLAGIALAWLLIVANRKMRHRSE